MQSRRVLSAKVSVIDSLSNGKQAGNFMMIFDGSGKCYTIKPEPFIYLFPTNGMGLDGLQRLQTSQEKSAFEFSRGFLFLML